MHPHKREPEIKVKTAAPAQSAPFGPLVLLVVIVLLIGAASGM